jgi:hypothetical protein
MLIEATQQPIRYRLQSGVEVLLRPGVPTELTDEAGRQLVKKAGSKVRVVTPAIHPGDEIIWRRADGTTQIGLVDFIHVDAEGHTWAFVTIGETWAIVNLKFAKVVNP